MTPTRVLPLTGTFPAGIPASPDPTADVTLTCLKCGEPLHPIIDPDQPETLCHCRCCDSIWDTDEMHGQAMETLREAWKLMVAA